MRRQPKISQNRKTDQYIRETNIINDVPQSEDEVMKNVIKKVATALEVELREYDAEAIHTLPSARKIRPIIVRFNNSDIFMKITQAA